MYYQAGIAHSTKLIARVISLPDSQSRRASVTYNLSQSKLRNWAFFDAATADRPIGLVSDVARQNLRFGRAMSGAEVGCFKSHFLVIKEFVDNPEHDWLLVLEDDVWVDPEFDFFNLIDEIEQRKINYVRLFARRLQRADCIGFIGEQQILRFRTDPYGTQAYLINRAGAKRFLDNVQAVDMPIDIEFGRFWATGLDIHAVFPFPVVEKAFASTIRVGRERNKTERPRPSFERFVVRLDDKFRKELANLSFLFAQFVERIRDYARF